jgi:hypothetical protein
MAEFYFRPALLVLICLLPTIGNQEQFHIQQLPVLIHSCQLPASNTEQLPAATSVSDHLSSTNNRKSGAVHIQQLPVLIHSCQLPASDTQQLPAAKPIRILSRILHDMLYICPLTASRKPQLPTARYISRQL